ncbi:(2Fe-2S) ferredoxin domain-containing protein [bacterium]|nr:(2Fe-2S) ferredoxin domain-containing protein [bacterium]MBU1153188.1 (2Fe-2S) ferredoxin domain-containing protein [bacterium]MBU2599929.1 (2Fe-2S) ferredoxin domain-containing protein [bacterium]
MPKIKPADLDKIREETKRTILLREGAGRARVIVHMSTCGIAAGARRIMKALMEEIDQKGIKDVLLMTSSCAGLCSREPMITVELKDEPPVKYVDITPEKIKRVFEEHVLGGKIVSEYALSVGSERVG